MPFKHAVKYDARLRPGSCRPLGIWQRPFTCAPLSPVPWPGRSAWHSSIPNAALPASMARTGDGQGFDFDVLELVTYHPQNYITAIHEAEAAGYGVLVIDSLTHAWNSVGGVLEIVDKSHEAQPVEECLHEWLERSYAPCKTS